MFPGMNQRKMQQMMKRMGIKQQQVEANKVIIKCPDKEIVIDQPNVSKVNMMGQQTYQVVGEEQVREVSSEPEISPEDVKTVTEQTKASEEEAKKAIKEAGGDLAQAIMTLKGQG